MARPIVVNVRDVKDSHLKCLGAIEGFHQWHEARPALWMFRRLKATGAKHFQRCANCKSWRYRSLNKNTGEWNERHWQIVHAPDFPRMGEHTRADFRKEDARRQKGTR